MQFRNALKVQRSLGRYFSKTRYGSLTAIETAAVDILTGI